MKPIRIDNMCLTTCLLCTNCKYLKDLKKSGCSGHVTCVLLRPRWELDKINHLSEIDHDTDISTQPPSGV